MRNSQSNAAWTSRKLGDIVDVASGLVDPRDQEFADFPHIGGDNIESNTGRLVRVQAVREENLISGKYLFGPDDVLYCKIRPRLNKVVQPGFVGLCSADIYPLRPHTAELDGRYLMYLLRTKEFLLYADKHSARTNMPKVNREALCGFNVNLPPLPDQHRIAAILDKADAIRRKRREVVKLADEFLKSAFLEMFGDPVGNPRGWRISPLGELCEFVGGGTPSRDVPEYFTGTTCWATSKDMKGEVLCDTEEHITPLAIAKSATKLVRPGCILVVVKSKVLMHRLPVAVNSVPTCFGQDLKAIVPHATASVSYLARHLRVGQSALLAVARGVNTEGLTLEHLRAYRVMMPPVELIEKWRNLEAKLRGARAGMVAAAEAADRLFEALVERAFSGAL